MALARYEGVVTDDAGNVVPLATIEVRRDQPGRPVVPLFADRSGTVPLGNPIQADALGAFGFHLPGGVYWVRAYSGPSHQPTFQVVKRYVAVGTAAERDVEDLAASLSAGIATFGTLAALETFEPETDTGVGGLVIDPAEPGESGYYTWDSVGSEWVKRRGLPDTLGRMEVTGGTANALLAAVAPGVDPANVVMLFLEPSLTNSAAVTINGLPLLSLIGEALLPGQLLAGRSYLLTDESDHYRLRNEGDVSGIPAGITAAAAAAMVPIASAVSTATTKAGEAVTARNQAQAIADSLDPGAFANRGVYQTWTALAAVTGAAPQAAEVLPSDAGTHTDPVVGGTVLNAGIYSWSASPAGWKWMYASSIISKANTPQVVAGARTDLAPTASSSKKALDAHLGEVPAAATAGRKSVGVVARNHPSSAWISAGIFASAVGAIVGTSIPAGKIVRSVRVSLQIASSGVDKVRVKIWKRLTADPQTNTGPTLATNCELLDTVEIVAANFAVSGLVPGASTPGAGRVRSEQSDPHRSRDYALCGARKS